MRRRRRASDPLSVGETLDVGLILKIAGIGMLVSVLCQVLSKSGKDEQAGYVTIAGILLVLVLLMSEITRLISAVRNTFGI